MTETTTRPLTLAIAAAAIIGGGAGYFGGTLSTPDAPVEMVQKEAPQGEALSLLDLDDASRDALQGEMRRYLLENPEIIVEVIGLLEAQQVAEAAEAERQMVADAADDLFNDGFSYVGGNPNGDITLVEFLDYQCGFCKRAHAEVQTLIQQDGNIRYVVKELPILGPMSVEASRAAVAVLIEDGAAVYERFNDTLMTFGGQLSSQVIDGLAQRAGADVTAMRAAMENNEEIDERIAATRALAGALEITGTPTFVMGDTVIRGFLPLPQMEEAVAAVRNTAN